MDKRKASLADGDTSNNQATKQTNEVENDDATKSTLFGDGIRALQSSLTDLVTKSFVTAAGVYFLTFLATVVISKLGVQPLVNSAVVEHPVWLFVIILCKRIASFMLAWYKKHHSVPKTDLQGVAA